jgi:hypothetical protein
LRSNQHRCWEQTQSFALYLSRCHTDVGVS